MKKKIITGLIVLVLFLLWIYAVYIDVFPKAEKFNYPDFSSVESITVSQDDEAINLNQEDCKMLYEYIRVAKPTREKSVNETPYVTPFYTVVIKSDDISHFGYGYIYEEQRTTYFEIPYVGVYTLDSDVLKYIKKQPESCGVK